LFKVTKQQERKIIINLSIIGIISCLFISYYAFLCLISFLLLELINFIHNKENYNPISNIIVNDFSYLELIIFTLFSPLFLYEAINKKTIKRSFLSKKKLFWKKIIKK